MKVLIIGGGASGMAAALSAAQDAGNQVTLLERQARVGRKLLATGNGRCNLTNRNLGAENYHGQTPRFVLPALERYGVERTLAAFETLGLVTVTEPSGRVYPFSDQANSVVDVLRFALEAAGVTVVCGCEVCEVKKKARGYQARAVTGETYFGDRLIVAAGGCDESSAVRRRDMRFWRRSGTSARRFFRALCRSGRRRTSFVPSRASAPTDVLR